ncbi:unnamed protein product [Nippostrongylus brasiliensis]|uniref:PAN domain protein n=1 Tax=Nippostrongylus brasiliensis TaxID=27835 RepID=A0A0N4YUE2_NIPBR|nr:unnamed protein product [Nippostrongylus brasiliensis]
MSSSSLRQTGDDGSGSPKHFEKELAESVTTSTETPAVVLSHQEDQAHVNTHEDQTPPTSTSASAAVEGSPASTIAGGRKDLTPTVRKHCLIKFQARPLSQRPAGSTAAFELEIPAESAEICATRCYQDGCSGAKYDPKAGSCSLSYNDKQHCTNEPVVLHYKAEELTWIHCVNCYTFKGTEETAPSTDTTSSTPSGTESTTEGSTPTETPSSSTASTKEENKPAEGGLKHTPSNQFQRGCLIKFQARPIENRPKEFTAPFELDLPVDSIGLCATRCYQDGCTGARYEPVGKICSLSYNDRPFCDNSPVTLNYDAKNTTWLNCVNCYTIKHSDKVIAPEATAAPSSEATTVTSETTTSGEATSVTTGVPREIGEPVAVLGNRSRSDSATPFQRGCAIKFQARPFSQRPAQFQAKFELELHVDSAEICAIRCYQDGCSGAKYDPKSGSCSLSYNDKQYCTNEAVLLQYRDDELTWIHCVNCYAIKDTDGTGPSTPSKSSSVESSTLSSATTSSEHSSTIAFTSTTGKHEEAPQSSLSNKFQRGCLIKFQARPIEDRPKQFTAPFELDVPVDSIELCAVRCYQGLPLSGEELIEGRGPHSGYSQPHSSTARCVVNFQIVELEERPPHFTAAFEITFSTETVEICAYRCYQDGCTGARYLPDSKQCSLSYNDRAFCSPERLVQIARPQQPVFIHCLSCVPRLPNLKLQSLQNPAPTKAPEASGEEPVEDNNVPKTLLRRQQDPPLEQSRQVLHQAKVVLELAREQPLLEEYHRNQQPLL